MIPQLLLILDGKFRAGKHEPPLARALAAAPAAVAQVLCLADAAVGAARRGAARPAARGMDPGRHRGYRDASLEAATARNSALLDLPGPHWQYRSDLAGESRWLALCRQTDAWCDTASKPHHKR